MVQTYLGSLLAIITALGAWLAYTRWVPPLILRYRDRRAKRREWKAAEQRRRELRRTLADAVPLFAEWGVREILFYGNAPSANDPLGARAAFTFLFWARPSYLVELNHRWQEVSIRTHLERLAQTRALDLPFPRPSPVDQRVGY